MTLSLGQRDTYLHAMGVQPWHAREAVNTKTVAEPDSPRETPAPPIKVDIKKDIFKAKPVIPAASQNDVTPDKSENKPAVQFKLAFVAFSDLLIVSELPLRENDVITPEQLRLLKAMRVALGYPAQEPAQHMIMMWPMVANAKMDQGEVAAFQSVQAQLKKQKEQYSPRYIVLMGVAACRYVLGLDAVFEQLRGQMIANESLCAVLTYGVNELLKVPSLKASAWQDLQVIRQK